MNPLQTPLAWIELSIALALLGALLVGSLRDPLRALQWGLAFTGATVVCSVAACLLFYMQPAAGTSGVGGWHVEWLGRRLLAVDDLNAPLLPVVALLHFLTALATGRTKMRRFSIRWSLACEALTLATFSCIEPWLLVALLAVGVVPPFVELRNRNQPTRLYALCMSLFVALLATGWLLMSQNDGGAWPSHWTGVPLLAAVLIRIGMVPAHLWVTDWFEHASFGNGLLFVTPLAGVYAAVRLLLPVAPEWMLSCLCGFALATAFYAAGMALVQHEARRFFAYLFLSHAALVLAGLGLHTDIGLTGALMLWISVALSLTGFGLTLRALEARFGRLSLARFHGLYEHSPALAVCFLLTGLASVGFPGTLGFVGFDLLVDSAVETSPFLGLALVAAAAINGIAIVKAYFRLFTGARHTSSVSLAIIARERFAVLTLAALILGGGVYPQPGIATRYKTAELMLEARRRALDPREAPIASANIESPSSPADDSHERE